MFVRSPQFGAARGVRRAFTLMEVLMAIFILGIGVISIAALFPAGIAQQRQSSDDAVGPLVAENALTIIRNKVKPWQFGTSSSSPTIVGDWAWSRPVFYPTDHTVTLSGTSYTIPAGSVSIFDPVAPFRPASLSLPEIPWSTAVYGSTPPAIPIIITQRERYYPEVTVNGTVIDRTRPQYVWDCAFRRFQGEMLVAIFVYRVNTGGTGAYVVAPNPSLVAPLPVSIDLASTPAPAKPWSNNPWKAAGDITSPDFNTRDDGRIPGTFPGDAYNPLDQSEGWQTAGQWLLDQNNNIHRVVSGRRTSEDGPTELARPVPFLSIWAGNSPYYSTAPMNPATQMKENWVTNFWYIPPVDINGVQLTPVYVTVREL